MCATSAVTIAGRLVPAAITTPGGSRPKPIPVVRAGERATAVFLADRLRMTASVTCLERGNEGEIIRVRSQDGHVFRARISGPALLEALPQYDNAWVAGLCPAWTGQSPVTT